MGKLKHKNDKKQKGIKIYTIGYQSFSIDSFINTLVKEGIKTIIDVRNTPFSYKYGFSKSWLIKFLSDAGIKYYSFPELGVEKEYRKEHFSSYYTDKLKTKKEKIGEVTNIIKSKPSALMCFEKNPQECHRGILAHKIKEFTSLEISHIGGTK